MANEETKEKMKEIWDGYKRGEPFPEDCRIKPPTKKDIIKRK